MLGVRLDEDTDQALRALARRTRRTRSDLVREAVQNLVRADVCDGEELRQLASMRVADAQFDWDYWASVSVLEDDEPEAR